jgi:hypothetical protein
MRSGLRCCIGSRVLADGRVDDGNEAIPNLKRLRHCQDEVILNEDIFDRVIFD